MNLKTSVVCLAVVAAAALLGSCSGSSSSNNNSGGTSSNSGAGKSSSNAGSSSAGTTNNGGSSSGGVSSNAGTTNSGGKPGNGGSASGGFNFGGNFNLGGAGIDPADYMCNPVPTKGSACAAGTQPCLDGTSVCSCQNMKWSCIDLLGGAGGAGGGQLQCPATQPMDGSDCGNTFGVCPYGQNMGCACFNGTWACG